MMRTLYTSLVGNDSSITEVKLIGGDERYSCRKALRALQPGQADGGKTGARQVDQKVGNPCNMS